MCRFFGAAPDTIECRCRSLANLLEVPRPSACSNKRLRRTAVLRKIKLRDRRLRRYGCATLSAVAVEGQSDDLLGLPIRKVLIRWLRAATCPLTKRVRKTICSSRIDTMGDFLQRPAAHERLRHTYGRHRERSRRSSGTLL